MLKLEQLNNVPANTALCAENCLPPRHSVTSLNEDLSNRTPRSSLSLHSGTLTGVQLDWPDTLTVSPTTDTCKGTPHLIITSQGHS